MKKMNYLSNYILRYNYLFRSRLNAIRNYHYASEQDLNELRNDKFMKLLKKAYAQSEFYQKFYNAYGVNMSQVQSLDDMHLLPEVKKEHIRNHFHDFLTTKKTFLTKGYTSGTSGTPLTLFRSYNSVIEENAYLWAHRSLVGHEPGMRAISLRGDLDAETRESFDPYTNTLFLSSFSLKEENANWYFEKIKTFKPNAIYAYPSSVETLCNMFQAIDKTFPIPYVFTSSETLYEFQRSKVSQVFGGKVFDWYGNAERSIALEEINHGSYREAPLYSINHYEDNRILTTGLINDRFPIIKYEVDDVINVQYDESGKLIEVTGIQGRKDDMLTFFDGTCIGRMSGALKGVDNVKYTQIVQNDPYSFNVNVVPCSKYSELDEENLRKKISSKVGQIPFEINIVKESQIIKSKAGKYKLIVNKCKEKEVTHPELAL